MQILRMSDRVEFEIGDFTFKFGPMSMDQKFSLEKYSKMKKGAEVRDAARASFDTIKYTVKGITGVENIDGTPYEVQFEDKSERSLTDNCVEDILNIPIQYELLITLSQLMGGVKNKIIDPKTGDELTKVRVNFPKTKVKKKKVT